ncbi:MAG: hypothetical protein U1F57_12355 [bacterium]
MFKLFNRLWKLALILVAVALIFDFHYKGRSTRDYAKEYGMKAFHWAYGFTKGLIGKDIEDLPKTFKDLPDQLKSGGAEKPKPVELSKGPAPTAKEEAAAKPAEAKPNEKQDSITPEDREALKKLLEKKMK